MRAAESNPLLVPKCNVSEDIRKHRRGLLIPTACLLLVGAFCLRLSQQPLVPTIDLEAVDDDAADTADYDEYSVGSIAPSFTLTTIENTTFEYKYDDAYDDGVASSNPLPLIIMALNKDDSSLMSMVTDVSSIDHFLQNSPTNVYYLFVEYGGTDEVRKLQVRLKVRMKALDFSADKIAAVFERCVFSGESLEKLQGDGEILANILHQGSWRSPFEYLSVDAVNTNSSTHLRESTSLPTTIPKMLSKVSRVDCELGWCSRPEEDTKATLIYGGDACPHSAPVFQQNPAGKYVLIMAQNCTYEDAARYVMNQTKAAGVIVVSNEEDHPQAIGGETLESHDEVVTCISFEVGMAIVKLFEGAESLSISLKTEMVPGYFIGIDSDHRLYQLGYWWTYTMSYISLEARYLQYMSTQYAREEKTNLEIPVFNGVALDESASINITDIPSSDVLRAMGQMELDLTLDCVGNLDQDCSKWDHVITLTAVCYDGASRRLEEVGGSTDEIGRWITPFRRNTGRWFTDISPLMPIFYDAGRCEITLQVTSSVWVASLSFRFYSIDQDSTPFAALAVEYPNDEVYFDSLESYNANRSVRFATPESTTKVVLQTIISGHGDCEFEPTSHHWNVNSDGGYNVSFFGAGTAYGCQDMALMGVETNEHGTWYYGRDGWCDGSPVQPHYFDITKSVNLTPGAVNSLKYYAYSYGDDDERWEDSKKHIYDKPESRTAGCGGYILMSTHIVFYD